MDHHLRKRTSYHPRTITTDKDNLRTLIMDSQRNNSKYGTSTTISGPASSSVPYNERPGSMPISGSNVEPEGKSGSRLGGFMKKMKEGPMATNKKDGQLQVVNE